MWGSVLRRKADSTFSPDSLEASVKADFQSKASFLPSEVSTSRWSSWSTDDVEKRSDEQTAK
jgi:hypothetical protein